MRPPLEYQYHMRPPITKYQSRMRPPLFLSQNVAYWESFAPVAKSEETFFVPEEERSGEESEEMRGLSERSSPEVGRNQQWEGPYCVTRRGKKVWGTCIAS